MVSILKQCLKPRHLSRISSRTSNSALQLNWNTLCCVLFKKNYSSDNKHLRLVVISDTHSCHSQLGQLPHGDVLLHGGDFTENSFKPRPEEYKDFIDWFASQPHKHKIFISGNRDMFMDSSSSKKSVSSYLWWMEQMQQYAKEEKSIVYLQDSSYSIPVHDGHVTVYGSPWTMIYGRPGKAFQIPPSDLSEKWVKIPPLIDILVTHSPPYSICDSNTGKVKSGCKYLKAEVLQRIKPKVHIFGHIHEGRGHKYVDKTLFVNASNRRPGTTALNRPYVIDLPACGQSPPILSEG